MIISIICFRSSKEPLVNIYMGKLVYGKEYFFLLDRIINTCINNRQPLTELNQYHDLKSCFLYILFSFEKQSHLST